MKHEPWQYALTLAVLCLLAVPAAVFLLVLAALLLPLSPLVVLVVYCACKAVKRAERRNKYGGPRPIAHPVETCPCEACAGRREYLYGRRDPVPQA